VLKCSLITGDRDSINAGSPKSYGIEPSGGPCSISADKTNAPHLCRYDAVTRSAASMLERLTGHTTLQMLVRHYWRARKLTIFAQTRGCDGTGGGAGGRRDLIGFLIQIGSR
jgi:hypothetical protein